jgi:hypothetical protein
MALDTIYGQRRGRFTTEARKHGAAFAVTTRRPTKSCVNPDPLAWGVWWHLGFGGKRIRIHATPLREERESMHESDVTRPLCSSRASSGWCYDEQDPLPRRTSRSRKSERGGVRVVRDRNQRVRPSLADLRESPSRSSLLRVIYSVLQCLRGESFCARA